MAALSFTLACLMAGAPFPGRRGDAHHPTPTPKRKRGRPPTSPKVKARRAAGSTLLTDPPPKKRGAPKKITPEVELWFLADIDRVKAKAAAHGRKVSDSAALRSSIAKFRRNKYREDGLSDAEANRRAKAAAYGPLFRTRKSTLSRLRHQASKTRR